MGPHRDCHIRLVTISSAGKFAKEAEAATKSGTSMIDPRLVGPRRYGGRSLVRLSIMILCGLLLFSFPGIFAASPSPVPSLEPTSLPTRMTDKCMAEAIVTCQQQNSVAPSLMPTLEPTSRPTSTPTTSPPSLSPTATPTAMPSTSLQPTLFFTPSPTMSSEPTSDPSPMPTPVCGRGQYYERAILSCANCPEGRYSNRSTAQGGCDECLAGTYTDQKGSAACNDCPVGRAAPTAAATICPVCGAGTIARSTGSLSCDLCSTGKFNADAGTSALLHDDGEDCMSCPGGAFSNEDRTRCVQ